MILFDLPKIKERIKVLEDEQNADGFWGDKKSAVKVLNEYNSLKNKVNSFEKIQTNIQDLQGILEDESLSMMIKPCSLMISRMSLIKKQRA